MKVMLCTNINQEMSFVLKPKCIPEDSSNHALQLSQCLGHSAEGYITPCCWMDSEWNLRDYAQDIFYQDKFKISNVQNIKEITQSEEWKDFYIMLQERPEDAPSVCRKYCFENSVGDKYGKR